MFSTKNKLMKEKKYVNLVRVIYGKRNIKQILPDIQ